MKKNSPDICPFCSEKILHTKFDESNKFIAIYNIAPILPGHSLIIPKKHVESLLDLTEEDLYEMVSFSRNVVKALLMAFNVNAFNWTIQEGEEAGQTVSHLHLHLIPRQMNDLPRPSDWYPLLRKSEANIIDSKSRKLLTSVEIKTIIGQIRKYIK